MPSSSSWPNAVLTARGVRRERGNHLVLADVSVTVGPDARIGVVGPNGVGKSTLLRILAGLERPDAGIVELAPSDATVGHGPKPAKRPPPRSSKKPAPC